jgi:hypothetical protein
MTTMPSTTIGFRTSCPMTRRVSVRDGVVKTSAGARCLTATAPAADTVAIYEYRICGSSQP